MSLAGYSRTRSRPPSTRPATALTTEHDRTDPEAGSWILSILPARGQGRQVGLVALEKDTARVTVSHLAADSPTWVKTVHLARTRPPCVVLLPSTALFAQPLAAAMRDDDQSDSVAHGDDPALATTTTSTGAADPQVAMLVKALQANFPDATFVPVMRKYWNEQASLPRGYEYLTRLIVHSDDRPGILTSCREQYYALSAASALFHWLEHAQGLAFAPRTLRITYEPPEGTCLIDRESARNLELVSNLLNKNSKQHLLGMLNHCFTPMGTRFLRASILSPLTDTVTLDGRLDAVEELVNSEERYRAVRKALEPLKALDLDKIVTRLLAPRRSANSASNARKSNIGGGGTSNRLAFFSQLGSSSSTDPSLRIAHQLSHLLSLRTFLNAVPALRASVEHASAPLLGQVEKALWDERIEEIKEVLREGMNEDVWSAVGGGGGNKKGKGKNGAEGAMVGKHQRLFAIKSEKKRLLDVARETYRENMSDIHDLCDTFRERYRLETLDLRQSDGLKGAAFVLRLGKEEWDEKKGELALGRRGVAINVSVKKNKVEFQTLDLMKLNSRLAASEEEILIMSEDVLEEIFEAIKDKIACLYRCAEAIALLEMVTSFAEMATKNEYVRPEWTDTLAIKQGRHPLHEQFRMSDGSFVPNDTYANDAASFQIINGPNMSGKSTFLRQIALLHVMAQIGSFVPAQYASFRPVSALLTRLSNDDNLEASLSTFASEMTTMSMILGTLKAHADDDGGGGGGGGGGSSRSRLVIVDELGRGTSPDEGLGIAHAIAEEIIKSKASCFFATHFKELSITLPARYPNVVPLHFETEIDPQQRDFSLTFRHRLRDGSTPQTHYGLELAKMVKLPNEVLERGRLVSMTLASLARDGQERAGRTKLTRRRKMLLELRTTLKELAESTLTDASKMRKMMRELQLQTVQVLSETIEITAMASGASSPTATATAIGALGRSTPPMSAQHQGHRPVEARSGPDKRQQHDSQNSMPPQQDDEPREDNEPREDAGDAALGQVEELPVEQLAGSMHHLQDDDAVSPAGEDADDEHDEEMLGFDDD
ncbi:hypothetical protein JCM10908_006137 [Rhodotorula pacifica]|uniref:MutS family protein MSH4 n=1 Tax=Rhodotorula pacifica TaxID=1495444 RepID=UPI00316F2D94